MQCYTCATYTFMYFPRQEIIMVDLCLVNIQTEAESVHTYPSNLWIEYITNQPVFFFARYDMVWHGMVYRISTNCVSMAKEKRRIQYAYLSSVNELAKRMSVQTMIMIFKWCKSEHIRNNLLNRFRSHSGKRKAVYRTLHVIVLLAK